MEVFLTDLSQLLNSVVHLGGEAVTTPTFQLGSTGSTPGGDIFIKSLQKP